MPLERRSSAAIHAHADDHGWAVAGSSAGDHDDLAPFLAPDERVLTFRSGVGLDRRLPCRQPGLRGDLHLTDRRLLLVGAHPVEIPLETIVDAAVVDDHLLLMLCGGNAITIRAEDPLLLRKEISGARAARRGDRAADARRRVPQSSEA